MSDVNGSKMKIKICHTVRTIRKSRKTKNIPHSRNNSKTKIYHTVGTIPTSNRQL